MYKKVVHIVQGLMVAKNEIYDDVMGPCHSISLPFTINYMSSHYRGGFLEK